MNAVGRFLLGLVILIIIMGLIFLGLQSIFEDPFAKGIANQLAVTVDTQAQALLKAQEVQLEMARLNYMLAEEQVREARSARMLNTVLTVAIVVMSPILVILAAYALYINRQWIKARFAKKTEDGDE